MPVDDLAEHRIIERNQCRWIPRRRHGRLPAQPARRPVGTLLPGLSCMCGLRVYTALATVLGALRGGGAAARPVACPTTPPVVLADTSTSPSLPVWTKSPSAPASGPGHRGGRRYLGWQHDEVADIAALARQASHPTMRFGPGPSDRPALRGPRRPRRPHRSVLGFQRRDDARQQAPTAAVEATIRDPEE
jgi:hypothetical protein